MNEKDLSWVRDWRKNNSSKFKKQKVQDDCEHVLPETDAARLPTKEQMDALFQTKKNAYNAMMILYAHFNRSVSIKYLVENIYPYRMEDLLNGDVGIMKSLIRIIRPEVEKLDLVITEEPGVSYKLEFKS